jgi:hypothetical protein
MTTLKKNPSKRELSKAWGQDFSKNNHSIKSNYKTNSKLNSDQNQQRREKQPSSQKKADSQASWRCA